MIEKIIGALRKSFLLVFFRNIWLFWIALAYSLLAMLLIFGATALPVVFWVASGRGFEPGLLFSQPLEFIIQYRMLIIYSLAGYTAGFILFLVIWLYYHGALTAVVTRAVGNYEEEESGRVEPGMFFRDGGRYLAKSSGTAALAGLLPLPPLVVLMALAVILLFRLAAGDWMTFARPPAGMIIFILAAGLALAATVLLTILAVLWYRYSLCAVCADGLTVGKAMHASLGFFKRCWHGVLGLVLASVLLSLALGGVTWPISYAIEVIGDFSAMLKLLLKLPVFLVSMVAGIGFDLWMKAALVVFYIDNRTPVV